MLIAKDFDGRIVFQMPCDPKTCLSRIIKTAWDIAKDSRINTVHCGDRLLVDYQGNKTTKRL